MFMFKVIISVIHKDYSLDKKTGNKVIPEALIKTKLLENY
jgi:hypothetical protein